MQILPWQEDNWQQLAQRHTQDQLPHALLLHGPAGTGKREFALSLAEALLCNNNNSTLNTACGTCSACSLLQAETHPDFFMVEPEEEGKAIKIDQIRGLIEKLTLSSHAGGYKIAIINPAEAMNSASANSLLKTLEEPPSDTIIILVSSKPSVLPATVRSRCQMLRMDLPGRQIALNWLQQHIQDENRANILLDMTGGSPLNAKRLADESLDEAYQVMLQDWLALGRGQADPVKTAEQWLKVDQYKPIFWVYEWISQMIKVKSLPDNNNVDNNQAELKELVQNVQLKELFGLFDEIAEALKIAHTQANHLMLLERILVYWSNLPRQKV